MLIKEVLKKRILILDGAMGSLIQEQNPKESDYRGEKLKNHPINLKGNHELLNLHAPNIINNIYADYLKAGADIITTNTLNGNIFSQREYQTEQLCYEINREAARIGKKAAEEYSTDEKPRFVAGSIGPTSKSLSMSGISDTDQEYDFSFEKLVEAYKEQIAGLFDGGADVLLIETIFDTLNTKAAIYAANKIFEEKQAKLPIIISATVSGNAGRLLSGQTITAFYHSIKHADPLAVGLNCSFGAKDLQPFIEELSKELSCYLSFYPNAGMPDHEGKYTQTPEQMAQDVKNVLQKINVNIIGGCCGTTPSHIKAFSSLISDFKPAEPPAEKTYLTLSGLEPLKVNDDKGLVYIGERTNVAGSKKFARLIESKNYNEALDIAQNQVESGAKILDICMDAAEIDSVTAIKDFTTQLKTHPLLAKTPLMIDSSDFKTIITGLQNIQGKSIVNSISLKGGEKDFLNKAAEIKNLGASLVVMLFDEKGQADTTERRVEITKRSYDLLTKKAGIKEEDIIFDPNVMALGTGIGGSNDQAVSFLETCRFIKSNYPKSNITGGVSNLSFAFRGANKPRQAIHHVFLKEAHKEGMRLPIVNPSEMKNDDFPEELLKLAEDIVFNKNPKAVDEILKYIESSSPSKKTQQPKTSWREFELDQKLKHALINGIDDYLHEDIDIAVKELGDPYKIIDDIFMPAMDEFSKQFDEGTLFLPQVIRSATIFQKAVKIIQPYLTTGSGNKEAKGKVVLATVEGDVHDIGKNIAAVVFECNGFDVIDMGVMIPARDIVDAAIKENADIIGLSGLITPSLQEMVKVAEIMQQEKLNTTLVIGGATTSVKHTEKHITPVYNGKVRHVADASKIGSVIKN